MDADKLPAAVRRSIEIRDALVTIPTVDFDALLEQLVEGVGSIPDPRNHEEAVKRFRMRDAIDRLKTYSPTHLKQLLVVKQEDKQ